MAGTIVDGLVHAAFDDKVGIVLKATVPRTLDRHLATAAAERSLSILAGAEKVVPRDVEIVSVPGRGTKIMVKFVQIEDPTARGGFVNSTLCVVFKEEHDVVFYKYFSEFNALMDGAATLVRQARDAASLASVLDAIAGKVHAALDEFREAELATHDTFEASASAFPDEDTGDASPGPAKAYRCKIIVCGDPRVGKTSAILRFTNDAFRRTYLMTVGVNLSVKVSVVDAASIEYTIWDIAGQAKFQVMRKRYYENARGFLLVFDKTRRETFENLPAWFNDIRQHLGTSVPGLIIANKADLEPRVTAGEIEAAARSMGLACMDTSAKDGTNIVKAFHALGRAIVSKGGKAGPVTSGDGARAG